MRSDREVYESRRWGRNPQSPIPYLSFNQIIVTEIKVRIQTLFFSPDLSFYFRQGLHTAQYRHNSQK